MDVVTISREEIMSRLKSGILVFHYRKLNGTLRKARGTLCLDLIPESDHPKGIKKPPKDDTINYYDFDKGCWRSFKLHRVTSYYHEAGGSQ